MKKNFGWMAQIGVLMLATAVGALAQGPTHFRGVFNDYTPANTGGPWEVRGQWSLFLVGTSGSANFDAAVTMGRSDLGVMQNGGGDLNNPTGGAGGTPHITLVGGTETALANGFRVIGTATVTGVATSRRPSVGITVSRLMSPAGTPLLIRTSS